jgi:hypothetical protein
MAVSPFYRPGSWFFHKKKAAGPPDLKINLFLSLLGMIPAFLIHEFFQTPPDLNLRRGEKALIRDGVKAVCGLLFRDFISRGG